MACNRQMCNKLGFLTLKTLTEQEHRSIPCKVMRYTSLLLLLLILPASAQRAYSQECPVVTVSCPDSSTSPRLTFSANVSGGDPDKLTFNWTVSAGKITDGQDTASIIVDTAGLGGISFTATVEVGGIPNKCGNKASCSIIVCDLVVARKFDEYGDLSWAEERARLDMFAGQLKSSNELTSTSHHRRSSHRRPKHRSNKSKPPR